MDTLSTVMKSFNRENIREKVTKIYEAVQTHHLLLYLMAVVFCMRWDFLYCRSLETLLIKVLPLQLLCLGLGVGLEVVIRTTIENRFPDYTDTVQFVYFTVAYLVLMTTGVLWSSYADLTLLLMYALVIGLLRIIEKNKIGIFAKGNKSLVRELLLLVFIFFLVVDLAYKPLSKAKQSSVNSIISANAEMVLNTYSDKLSSLKQAKWEKLSVEERLEVLQLVVNVELNHLGLNHELRVYASPLGKASMACYKPQNRTIHINRKQLEYAYSYEMLNSVAHESYHAYQHRMVETYRSAGASERSLLYFRRLAQYDKEMNNYISGEADYEGYYNQTMEVDARAYGKERARYYYEKLGLKE